MCAYAYLYVCVSLCVCIYLCMYVCIHVCKHVCMYMSVNVCVYICLYCLSVCHVPSMPDIKLTARTHTHIYIHTYMCRYLFKQPRTFNQKKSCCFLLRRQKSGQKITATVLFSMALCWPRMIRPLSSCPAMCVKVGVGA